jgi:DNA-binding response OmpR family regulator
MSNGCAILVAEDDEDDVFFLRRAWQASGYPHQLFVTRDGQEAVRYLNGDSRYSDRKTYPVPRLVMLDVKMPRMNGFDVLEWLQTHSHFQQVPVVVLSSSSQESDRQRALKLGAHDYLVKPLEFENLVKLIKQVHGRWLA